MTTEPRSPLKRVLVVHEDADVRATILRGLTSRLGEEVLVEPAADYAEVLLHLERGGFDLVIFHVNLPGEDPYHFVSALTVFAPGVPLLALSVHASDESEFIVREMGCAGLVALPPHLDALSERAGELLGRGPDAHARGAWIAPPPRVLVVDDDELVRHTVGAVLHTVAHVTVIGSPVDALTLMRSEPFDVLIADLKMPEMDGVTLIKHARRLRPEIMPIVLTGFPELESAVASFQEGGCDYLAKPIEPALLRNAVARAWNLFVVNRQRAQLFRDFERAMRSALTAKNKLREILDHMKQAVLVFGPDGKVEDVHSVAATKLFGEDAAGKHIADVLFDTGGERSTRRQLFDMWFEVAFTAAESDWEVIEGAAPTEASVQRADASGEKASLLLEFCPIFERDQVSRVLLIATDVSEQRRLSAEVAAQQARHDEELAAMRSHIAGSGPAFAGFLHLGAKRVEEARNLAMAEAPTPETIGHALLLVRALRSDARAFGQNPIAVECERLEAALASYQCAPTVIRAEVTGEERARSRGLQRDVVACIAASERALETGRELFVKASPTGRVALDQLTIRRTDLERLEALVHGRSEELKAAVSALRYRPFGECCAAVAQKALEWSDLEGRPVSLTVEGAGVPVPGALADTLSGVLAHLVRNAIAHGIETARERATRGKPHRGSILLVAERKEGTDDISIRVRDDGRGVDEKSVRARSNGTMLESMPPEELIFAHGLATADPRNELAGLGIGLYAVREELRAIGYDVRSTWIAGEGTTFTIARDRGVVA